MFLQMIRFEWHYFLRQPSLYITSIIFFTLGFLITGLNSVGLGGSNMLKNGPYAIAQVIVFFNFLSMFLVINFVAETAIRDNSSRMAELLYSKPINPLKYQIGRLLGSMSVVLLVTAMVPLGMLAGSLMPWINPDRFGATNLGYFVSAYSYFTVPTVVTLSLIFFALAVRLKTMMAVYLSAVGVFVIFEFSDALIGSADNKDLAALLDPFAIYTLEHVTRYWTLVEKNSQSFQFSGILLQSRLLWVSLGLGVFLLLGGLKTNFYHDPKLKTIKARKSKDTGVMPSANRIDYRGSAKFQFSAFFMRCKFEVKQTIFSPSFYILEALFVAILLSVFSQPYMGLISPVWPFTQFLIDEIELTLAILVPVVITYYSGEVLWRDQQDGFADIIGSMPTLNIVFWASKLVAMCVVVLLILLLAALIGMAYPAIAAETQLTETGNQTISQTGLFANVELFQYMVRLMYFNGLPWLMMIVLAMVTQVLSPNKYVGMLLFVLFIISGFGLDTLGLTSKLYHFAASPAFIYSDMNGYGRALLSHSWFMLYWGALTLLLSVLGYSLWQRGPQQSLRSRIGIAKHQIGSFGRVMIVALSLTFITSGGFIYYNTRVLNDYIDTASTASLQADYEKQYSQYENSPVPIIISVNALVDIYPEQLEIHARADIVVKNKTAQPIDKFLVTLPQFSPTSSLEIAGGELLAESGPYKTHWFKFDQPLQPGEERAGVMKTIRQHRGFLDGAEDISLVENGTAIDNSELFPSMGYYKQLELVEQIDRKEHDLPPVQRANKLEDRRFYSQSAFGRGVDFVDFEATVSTSIDQTAIAPGYLQKTWLEGGRRYFHYKMDAPMINFYSFVSARLEVFKEQYKGIALEVYFHPGHEMNLNTVMASLRDSIDYFSENFGPYQYRQMRVIEVPRYRNFAQGFANTIPYPEHGLLTDLRNPQSLNTLYNITSHEVAHQWWAHQVGAADVQGKEVLSETLSEYSALLVVAKRFGEDKLRRHVQNELDGYLRGRSRDAVEEMPLLRAENQQYIHYQKGAMVMMRLRDQIGEGRVNTSLRSFLQAYKNQTDPYPTTLDLVRHLQSGATQKERGLIADLFEKITIYDVKLEQASVTILDSGQYEIMLSVNASRYQVDGVGNDTPISLDETMDVALFRNDPDDLTSKDNVLYLQKHQILNGDNVITLLVDTLPGYAAIDPLIKIIDRDSVDNVLKI